MIACWVVIKRSNRTSAPLFTGECAPYTDNR